MKLHRNTLLTAAALVLVLYVVARIAGLPSWAPVVLAVVLLVLLAVVWKQPDPPKPVVAAAPAAPAPVVLPDPVFSGPPTRTVVDVRLPSASADFQFSFSAVVQWSTVLAGSRHADLGAVAVHALLERARALTTGLQVTEEALNQHRLAAILGEPALDDKGQVRCWATEIRLRLPDADQRHLQHLAALHRHEQTTLLERRMEQDKRAYLKEDVFASPGSAAVWWLVNHPGQVENALGLLDTLADLSAAANDLPPRRDSAQAVERTAPTRAELEFTAAVDQLEAGRPANQPEPPAEPPTTPSAAPHPKPSAEPNAGPPTDPNPGPAADSAVGLPSHPSAGQSTDSNAETTSEPSVEPPHEHRQAANGTTARPAVGPGQNGSATQGDQYREKFYSE
ncbi:hypothetical protein HPO96_25665 [Kribbella sandramycini]|uniref:Uncharacterized protein n=1 Tax=Kribbella sandramycini TaxID=60450 RepID=A0A7Y4P304_9ACTN|nr:hypothetical protein [Kribbella sandramycini]MBB6570493.1 hypothetical protein [Kribbella sandramycini]NOL43639.1 hypothetical protein [Kribbella sandramycini]